MVSAPGVRVGGGFWSGKNLQEVCVGKWGVAGMCGIVPQDIALDSQSGGIALWIGQQGTSRHLRKDRHDRLTEKIVTAETAVGIDQDYSLREATMRCRVEG
ncbi:MAG TPA: hypothetical protein VN371_04115 [Chlorobaculum sp.]|nr:hypothetical protein [Chlorobaculum sp.]